MRWSPAYTALSDSKAALHRFGHCALAVDAQATFGTDLVVVYGGVGTRPSAPDHQTALSDLLVLNVEAGTWFAPDAGGATQPGPRAFQAGCTVGRKLFIFGGHILVVVEGAPRRKQRIFFDDLWALDTEEWRWELVTPAQQPQAATAAAAAASSAATGAAAAPAAAGFAPSRRDMAALVALSPTTLLLFGGRSESGRGLSDTWVFDLPSSTWTQLHPGGATPPGRKMHALAKLAGAAVMFGGEKDSGPLDDVWVLTGALGPEPRWTQVRTRTPPGPRFGHAMIALPAPRDPPPTDPPPSWPSAGGASADGTASSALSAAPAPSASPPSPSSASSPTSSRLLVFGGCLDQSGFLALARSYVQTREAWVLDMATLSWTRVHSEPSPSERMCATLTALADGRVLLMGGRRREGVCDDLWWLDALAPPPSEAASEADALPSSAPSEGSLASGATTPTKGASPPRPGAPSLLHSFLHTLKTRDGAAPAPLPPLPPAAASRGGGGGAHAPPADAAAHPWSEAGSVDAAPRDARTSEDGRLDLGAGGGAPLAGAAPSDAAAPAVVPSSVGEWAPWRGAAPGAGGPLTHSSGVANGALSALSSSLASAGQLGRALLTQGGTLLAAGGQSGGALGALSSRWAPTLLGAGLGQRHSAPGASELSRLRADMGLPPLPSPLLPPASSASISQGLLLLAAAAAAAAAALSSEVLLSAGRQHLMAAPVEALTLGQVQLLLGDYQSLAAARCGLQLLDGLRTKGAGLAGSDLPSSHLLATSLEGLRLSELPDLQRAYGSMLQGEGLFP